MRSNPKADVPAELGEHIDTFKAEFMSALAQAERDANPLATDAGEVGEAQSQKTLATE